MPITTPIMEIQLSVMTFLESYPNTPSINACSKICEGASNKSINKMIVTQIGTNGILNMAKEIYGWRKNEARHKFSPNDKTPNAEAKQMCSDCHQS